MVKNDSHTTAARRPRIIALDLIRGLFMISIIVNHLTWSNGPSLYSLITGQSSLLASAAEGFFAISGILVGYIYGPRIIIKTKEVWKKLTKRAFVLWALAVFFTLFYAAWATLEPDSAKFATLYDRGASKFFVDILSMRYAFGWADFLTRYAVFMLIAPPALWLLARGKGWIVAASSVVIWALLRKVDLFLPFSAWQIVFFLGMIIGYYLPTIERFVRSWPARLKRISFTVIVSVFISTFVLSLVVIVILPMIIASSPGVAQIGLVEYARDFYTSIRPYFDKVTLDPARIIIGAVWFSGLYLLFRRYEDTINAASKGVLLLFGKNSLYIYCWHAFILFAIDLYIGKTVGNYPSIVVSTLITTAVLGLIYILTQHRTLFTRARYALLPSTRPNKVV